MSVANRRHVKKSSGVPVKKEGTQKPKTHKARPHPLESKLTKRTAEDVVKTLIANFSTHVKEYTGPMNDDLLKELLKNINDFPQVIRGGMKFSKLVTALGDEKEFRSMAEKDKSQNPKRRYTVYTPDKQGCTNQSTASHELMTMIDFLSVAVHQNKYLLGVTDKEGKRGASPFERLPSDPEAPVFASVLFDEELFFVKLYNLAGYSLVKPSMFLNSGFSMTNFHFDSDGNAYVCASGKRRWTLCHPDQGSRMTELPNKNYSNTIRPTLPEFSDALHVRALVKFVSVDLFPGDVLFVPPGWWHVVEGGVDSQPGSFSCALNWLFQPPSSNEAKKLTLSDVAGASQAEDFSGECPERELYEKLVALVESVTGPGISRNFRIAIQEACRKLAR